MGGVMRYLHWIMEELLDKVAHFYMKIFQILNYGLK